MPESSSALGGTVDIDEPDTGCQLLGIGEAAARTGVSERALRYYQELELITPSGRTPGGMRRYSEDDLARVTRIRELQSLLGLNLEEIAVVLRNDDRIGKIRELYHDRRTVVAERRRLAREGLAIQQDLRAMVESKRAALNDFLADLDAHIERIRALLEEGGAANP
ncbi:MAG: MerR family transcriptional regulator [Acidimicrobiales bacterium]